MKEVIKLFFYVFIYSWVIVFFGLIGLKDFLKSGNSGHTAGICQGFLFVSFMASALVCAIEVLIGVSIYLIFF